MNNLNFPQNNNPRTCKKQKCVHSKIVLQLVSLNYVASLKLLSVNYLNNGRF